MEVDAADIVHPHVGGAGPLGKLHEHGRELGVVRGTYDRHTRHLAGAAYILERHVART